MYILKIANHVNKKTKLTEHIFFFTAILKLLKHKNKHCAYLDTQWKVYKSQAMIVANNSKFMYIIEKRGRSMLWLKTTGLGIFVGALVLCFLFIYVRTPVVYKSHSQGECVKVDSSNASYTCQNLPTRYKIIWTK